VKINVKKLLGNKKTLGMIRSLAGGEEFAVLNAKGELIHLSEGFSSESPHRSPIYLVDQPIGWVQSTSLEKAQVIADFITYLGRLEHEKKALASETLAKYKEISLMSELNAKLAAVLHPQDVANTLIQELEKTLWADQILVAVYNPATSRLETLAQLSKPTAPLWDSVQLAAHWLRTHDQPEIINDLSRDPRFHSISSVSSMMAAPMIIKQNVAGGVFLFSTQYHSSLAPILFQQAQARGFS